MRLASTKKAFSFPEMIEWRKAKVVQERMQRNRVILFSNVFVNSNFDLETDARNSR